MYLRNKTDRYQAIIMSSTIFRCVFLKPKTNLRNQDLCWPTLHKTPKAHKKMDEKKNHTLSPENSLGVLRNEYQVKHQTSHVMNLKLLREQSLLFLLISITFITCEVRCLLFA